MIKLSISGNLEDICDFIDNRLILQLAEKNLRQLNPGRHLKLLFKKEYQIRNIDNTIPGL